jgi:hypothetical protein
MENHPREPFTIRFPDISASAGLLALGSSVGLPPSHQGVPDSGVSLFAAHVPDYSGGTATVFHRVP